MSYFTKIVRRVGGVGATIGACVLLGIVLLIVVNIIYRFFGKVIAGTYEIIEILIVITAVFAMSYTALKNGHVVINILTSRLPQRVQTILEGFTSAISASTWALIAWVSIGVLQERWLLEKSLLLGFPYLPLRFAWVLGMLLLCSAALIDLFRSFRREKE